MRQTTNKNLTKQILTLALAFVMVFTGMGIGSWGVDTAWATGESGSSPTSTVWDGTAINEPQQVDGVYQISTGAELAWFAAKVNDGTATNANAVLTDDIDLGSQEWTPIGNSDNPYSGNFDGQNHTISNLLITKVAGAVGTFGAIGEENTIQNLNVSGKIEISNVTNGITAGGVCGEASGGILFCRNLVNITIEASNCDVYVGGVCGFLYKGGYTIDGCENQGNIYCKLTSSNSDYFIAIAGIVGNIRGGGINACENRGNIKADLAKKGSAYYGGIANIAGSKRGLSLFGINACYNIGKIEGSLDESNGETLLAGGSIVGVCVSIDKDTYPSNCSSLEGTASAGMSDSDGKAITDVEGISIKSEAELKSDAFLAELKGADTITDYIVNWTKGADEYPKVSDLIRGEGIKSFKIGEVKAAIDRQNNTITAELPEDTVLTNLTPTITCFGNAAVTPASREPQDFTRPVAYRVGEIAYTVTLTVKQPVFAETGSEIDPYIINSAEKLLALSKEYNANPNKYKEKYWKQTAEIDMQGVKFTPIGKSTPFSGFYDGDGNAIKNLTISSGAREVGLFESVNDGSILKNIVLDESCRISGSAEGCSIGAIAGTLTGESIIENCVNEAAVTSSAPAGFNAKVSHAGGIVGSLASNSKVFNSKNYGTVSQTVAHNWYAGGIAGKQSPASIVAGCENHGTVSAASSASYGGPGTGSGAGGISAYSYGGYLSGCYNDGSVLAGQIVGGIVGKADSSSDYDGVIESCYNLGSVKGNASDADALLGGIVGSLSWTNLNNCYHAGTVTANSEASNTKKGAIVGQSLFMREVKGNYFLGAALSEAYGGMGIGDTAKEDNFKPMTAAAMKSETLLNLLTTYTEPYSLYLANWTADENKSNQGYPKFSKVEKILSHYAEMKSFTVTIDGKEYKGDINGTNINIVLPAGTTSITPTMTVSEKATVAPANDERVTLTNGSAEFTVTADNGKKSKTNT